MLLQVIAAAALVMEAQDAQPSARAPAVVVNPDWERLPTAEDVQRLYPEAAEMRGVEGRAVVVCLVTVDRTLSDCKVTLEEPADVGFGEAAIRLASLFRMRPMTKDGVPVSGGQFRLPIRFVLPVDPLNPALCYGLAADAAEREPSLKTGRTAAYWRYQVLMQSARSGRKPAEAEQDLAAARRRGEGLSARPNSQLEACLTAMPSSAR